jgi:hypothetical protein
MKAASPGPSGAALFIGPPRPRGFTDVRRQAALRQQLAAARPLAA